MVGMATTFLVFVKMFFIFQINLFFHYHVYFLRLQCIIKQLLNSVFVMCKIINVLVRIYLTFGSADNSYLDIDNSACNARACINQHLFNVCQKLFVKFVHKEITNHVRDRA